MFVSVWSADLLAAKSTRLLVPDWQRFVPEIPFMNLRALATFPDAIQNP